MHKTWNSFEQRTYCDTGSRCSTLLKKDDKSHILIILELTNSAFILIKKTSVLTTNTSKTHKKIHDSMIQHPWIYSVIVKLEETNLQCRGHEGPSKRHIPEIQESTIHKP